MAEGQIWPVLAGGSFRFGQDDSGQGSQEVEAGDGSDVSDEEIGHRALGPGIQRAVEPLFAKEFEKRRNDMTDRKLIPGKFVWFELASSDAKKAQAFYGEVLGWKVKPFPMS